MDLDPSNAAAAAILWDAMNASLMENKSISLLCLLQTTSEADFRYPIGSYAIINTELSLGFESEMHMSRIGDFISAGDRHFESKRNRVDQLSTSSKLLWL